jgi:pimeloyl-ACP methyl ester carboxylesterase
MDARLPIVYVRGYAGPTSGINQQVDDPFYGFNAGSTHVRVNGDGDPLFYEFEGDVLRLMIDEQYQILVHGDQRAFLSLAKPDSLESRSIWIHRFYDSAATTFGRRTEKYDIETAAERLYDLIMDVREKTGAPKVHLVAHSMGSLICRCMIQKMCRQDGRVSAADIVDKFCTMAGPHGGIEFQAGGGLLDWAMSTFGPAGSEIFAPPKMYEYLTPDRERLDAPPADWADHVKEIPAAAFPIDRMLCLIGTNSTDYSLVEKAVGPRSDGLVQIENAYAEQEVDGVLRLAHLAFVHRCHSGRFGIVNSEEAYQNLRRFLFGTFQVTANLVGLSLPADPRDSAKVWQADVRLAVRGLPIVMHEQMAAHYCPVQLSQERTEIPIEPDPDTPVPLAATFLLDARHFAATGPAPAPRSRYTLSLRVFHLTEKQGLFFWNTHLEQVPDWEDILIVDIGRRDDEEPGTMHVWANWNSSVAMPIDDFDPAATQAPLEFSEDGPERAAMIDVPEVGQAIVGAGTGQARIRLTAKAWNAGAGPA